MKYFNDKIFMKDLNVYFFGRPRKKNQENDFHEIFLELHFEINGTCMHIICSFFFFHQGMSDFPDLNYDVTG